MVHLIEDLIKIYNDLFFKPYNTKLVIGGDEPLYLPQNGQRPYHQIIFARRYFSSALHEIAHWCVAGPHRRLLEDYGYWYLPDGRDQEQQRQFELVEIKPQAYEWIFCASAGLKFHVSCDNFNPEVEIDRAQFTQSVRSEVFTILFDGMPLRVKLLSDALRQFYGVAPLTPADFME